MQLNYYKNLDGLRAIAAFMVLIQHFFSWDISNYAEDITTLRQIAAFGQHGVSLFFVLSGFVITRILIVSKNQKGYFRRFYWRRTLRIFPLYYLFLFFYYYVIQPYFFDTNVSLLLQLPYFVYAQNLGEILNLNMIGPPHYWSLAVEEHFYLIFPVLVYLVPQKYLAKFIVFIIFMVFFLKIYMINTGFNISQFSFTRMDQILLGAFLAILELRGFFKNEKNIIFPKIVFVVCVLLTFICFYMLGNSNYLVILIKYPLLGLVFASIIAYFIFDNSSNILNKFLLLAPVQYLGKISYGFYVWHIFALIFFTKVYRSELLLVDFLLCSALTIVLAHISYNYFEKLFLKLKDYKLKSN